MRNSKELSSDWISITLWPSVLEINKLSASRLLFLVTCVASVSLIVGCGGKSSPPLGRVVGKVLMNGDPVPGLSVVFVPEGHGSPSYGATNKDGMFRLFFDQRRVGAELGAHHVIIEHPDPQTDESGKPLGPPPVKQVAQKYRQPGALSAKVVPGHNKFDFEVEAEPKTSNQRHDAGLKRTSADTQTVRK